MQLRIKSLLTSTVITTLAITLAVLTFYYLTGGNSLYEAGRILLFMGTALAVIVVSFFYRSHHRERIRIHLHIPVEEKNKSVSDPYYDIFAGITFGVLLTVVVSFGIISLASKLEGRQSSDTNIPFVGSVKAELPNLHREAQKWQIDAYLVGLEYNFGRESPYNDYVFSAEFRSEYASDTLLVVELSREGNYIQDFYQASPLSQLPISDENWSFDSQEAISIFARDDGVRACLNFDREKELGLTWERSESHTVKWCLRVDGCAAIDGYTCIDAATGKKILFE